MKTLSKIITVPLFLFISVFLLISSGCSTGPLAVYKRDIQQGNIVEQSMVDKLRVGLSKSQVRKIMGSSVFISEFHQNQWHYYYTFKDGKTQVTTKKALTLFFDNDNLASYSGNWNIKIPLHK